MIKSLRKSLTFNMLDYQDAYIIDFCLKNVLNNDDI